jgi:GTP-binding protein
MDGNQTIELIDLLFSLLPAREEAPAEESVSRIRVAIAGRPNVGKSTLLNHLLGTDRAVVSPTAGTTRDTIDAVWKVGGEEVLLIDTAGIRRKKAEKETVDKFAAIRTEEAIGRSDVVLLLFDAYEGLTAQEKRIANEIEAMGKSCILVFNKWDLIDGLRMEHALRGVHEEVPFLKHCPTIFISAKSGRNAEKIFPLVKSVYEERSRRIGTGELNKFIERCVQKNHPPMYLGKRLRIYYMTQAQVSPPRFVFFINRPDLMVESYKKYLINQFRETYNFSGCPLFFELRGKKSAASLLSEAPL